MGDELQLAAGEEDLSLSPVATGVSRELALLGLEGGGRYLDGVKVLVERVDGELAAARAAVSALTAQAAAADDTAVLWRVNDRAAELAGKLFLSLRSVRMVEEICTRIRGVVAGRALELARRELYFSGTFCQLPLALFSVGSDGRGEQTLYGDQDFLFLYGTPPGGAGAAETTADFYGLLGALFIRKLEEAGIARCSGGIMPLNDEWRGSWSDWRERLETAFLFQKSDCEKRIVNLIALMDARFVCGDRELAAGFAEFVRKRTRQENRAMREMARVVSAMRLSKGFLRWFVVEAEDPHKGEFNLKLLAWTPLVMGVRLLAVDYGIEATSTLERISALRREGGLTERLAGELSQAYHVISRLRVVQQIKRRKRIIDHECYLNPYELPTPEREELRSAIGSIEELQNLIRNHFWLVSEAAKLVASLR